MRIEVIVCLCWILQLQCQPSVYILHHVCSRSPLARLRVKLTDLQRTQDPFNRVGFFNPPGPMQIVASGGPGAASLLQLLSAPYFLLVVGLAVGILAAGAAGGTFCTRDLSHMNKCSRLRKTASLS